MTNEEGTPTLAFPDPREESTEKRSSWEPSTSLDFLKKSSYDPKTAFDYLNERQFSKIKNEENYLKSAGDGEKGENSGDYDRIILEVVHRVLGSSGYSKAEFTELISLFDYVLSMCKLNNFFKVKVDEVEKRVEAGLIVSKFSELVQELYKGARFFDEIGAGMEKRKREGFKGNTPKSPKNKPLSKSEGTLTNIFRENQQSLPKFWSERQNKKDCQVLRPIEWKQYINQANGNNSETSKKSKSSSSKEHAQIRAISSFAISHESQNSRSSNSFVKINSIEKESQAKPKIENKMDLVTEKKKDSPFLSVEQTLNWSYTNDFLSKQLKTMEKDLKQADKFNIFKKKRSTLMEIQGDTQDFEKKKTHKYRASEKENQQIIANWQRDSDSQNKIISNFSFHLTSSANQSNKNSNIYLNEFKNLQESFQNDKFNFFLTDGSRSRTSELDSMYHTSNISNELQVSSVINNAQFSPLDQSKTILRHSGAQQNKKTIKPSVFLSQINKSPIDGGSTRRNKSLSLSIEKPTTILFQPRSSKSKSISRENTRQSNYGDDSFSNISNSTSFLRKIRPKKSYRKRIKEIQNLEKDNNYRSKSYISKKQSQRVGNLKNLHFSRFTNLRCKGPNNGFGYGRKKLKFSVDSSAIFKSKKRDLKGIRRTSNVNSTFQRRNVNFSGKLKQKRVRSKITSSLLFDSNYHRYRKMF